MSHMCTMPCLPTLIGTMSLSGVLPSKVFYMEIFNVYKHSLFFLLFIFYFKILKLLLISFK